VPQVSIQPTLHDGPRGRPRPGASPRSVDDPLDGALASSWTAHHTRVVQQRGLLLATLALDHQARSPQEVLDASKGQQHAARGVRFLKDPQVLASSRALKKPERIMALLMGRTVCVLVYAALEDRIRKTLNDHQTTFPDQQGQPLSIPPPAGCFTPVSDFMCSSSLGHGPSCSI
jgi:hypothetical protein